MWFKRYTNIFTNTHHDVTDLVNHGMVKNTETWISWEQNITFLWNKEILKLCLKWHIFWSYCFAAEITFRHPEVFNCILYCLKQFRLCNSSKLCMFSLGIRMKDSLNETILVLLHNMRLPCWKMCNPSAGTRWYGNLEWPYYFKSYSWRNGTQSKSKRIF